MTAVRADLRRGATLVALSLALAGPAVPARAAEDLEAGVADLARQISVNMANAQIKKIAIVEFADLDGAITTFGQFLAEELTTQLFIVSPGRFEVVERRQLARVLEEHKLSATGLLDADTIASLGKILGIEALVTGSIADLGNEAKVNARLISVETARVFAVAATTIPKTGTVQRLMEQVAARSSDGSLASAPASTVRLDDRGGGRPHFQNDIVEAWVRSASASGDDVTVAVDLRSRSREDLWLAIDSHGVLATDTAGSRLYFDRAGGLPVINYGFQAEETASYARLSAGSSTTIVFFLHGRDTIAADRISVSAGLFRLVDKKYTRMTLGIANIPLNITQPD